MLVAPGTDPASVGATAADSIVIAAADHRHHPGRPRAARDAAAAVYTFLVAWNGHPDLDGDLYAGPEGRRNAANGSVTR